MNIVTVAAHEPGLPRKSEADVVELPDGRLFMGYMEFFGDGSDDAHTRIAALESDDGGLTWGRYRILADTPSGDRNIYSPNLALRSDGSILLVCMSQHHGKPHSSTQLSWLSTDGCRTFAPFVTFAARRPFNLCNAVVRRLASGRLLLPVCVDGEPTRRCPGYSGTVLWSDDEGATWNESPHRIRLPMRGVMEPHVEETRDGRVLMVMRNQLGSLFVCDSRDGGITWSLPQASGLPVPESCPELRRNPATGDLLLVWNPAPYDPERGHFGVRTPLSFAVSRDEGRTWSPPRAIEDDPGRAFSNPGCRFLSNGDCLVHYWTSLYKPDGGFVLQLDLKAARLPAAWFRA